MVRWTARITRIVPGRLIEDVQEEGPFQSWTHQHRISASGAGSRLTDVVRFRFVPGVAGEFVDWLLVRPLLLAMFALRHRATRKRLAERPTIHF